METRIKRENQTELKYVSRKPASPSSVQSSPGTLRARREGFWTSSSQGRRMRKVFMEEKLCTGLWMGTGSTFLGRERGVEDSQAGLS